jgi:hypothetical protein
MKTKTLIILGVIVAICAVVFFFEATRLIVM